MWRKNGVIVWPIAKGKSVGLCPVLRPRSVHMVDILPLSEDELGIWYIRRSAVAFRLDRTEHNLETSGCGRVPAGGA